MNSSKLYDSVNKSLKHDSSSKSILKNNLKKINEKNTGKIQKESYNSQARKEEKIAIKLSIHKEGTLVKPDKTNITKKKSHSKIKLSNESKLQQSANKNLKEKVKEVVLLTFYPKY